MNPDITCEQYAQPFAFLGNSLLDTMRHTGQAGLDPAFWAAFPDVGDESVGAALDALFAWSQDAQARQKDGEDVLTEVCVEYTRLFVGPPSPAVAPWETFYRGNAATRVSERQPLPCEMSCAKPALRSKTKTTSTPTIWVLSCFFCPSFACAAKGLRPMRSRESAPARGARNSLRLLIKSARAGIMRCLLN